MHALLNGNLEDDILFVQEPWFGRIGTARDDVLHSGKSVLGGAANAQWTLHYPWFTDQAKVMTYVRIHDRSHPFHLNKCRGTTHLDLCAHPSILITDITVGSAYWRTINFYHDVDDPSSLSMLLSLDLDPTIPTLLIGDFNTHSASWSPLGWTKSTGQIESRSTWLHKRTPSSLSCGFPPIEAKQAHETAPLTLHGSIWLPRSRASLRG